MDESTHRRSGAAIESRLNEAGRSDETEPLKRLRFPNCQLAAAACPGAMTAAFREAP